MARAPVAAAPAEVVVEEPVAPDVAADVALEEEAAGEGVVVATILRNADGTYTLEAGDEPEGDPAMAAEGGGMAPMGAGETFPGDPDGIGLMMTALHELLDPDVEGGTQATANLNAGFGAPPEAPPA